MAPPIFFNKYMVPCWTILKKRYYPAHDKHNPICQNWGSQTS